MSGLKLLGHWNLDQAVQVQVLTMVIVLCSWVRHTPHIAFRLSYKWVLQTVRTTWHS